MQSTELLICLQSVNMVHHLRCSRMVRADHRAQFDANLLYCVLTLAGAHNAWVAEVPAFHRGGCQMGIQAVKMHLHKELFNCPEALWVLHLSLYPFNISYPGLNPALAKCLCLGFWNMNENAHLPIYLDVSWRQLQTIHLSPRSLPSAHLTGPRACLLQSGGGGGGIEGKGK